MKGSSSFLISQNKHFCFFPHRTAYTRGFKKAAMASQHSHLQEAPSMANNHPPLINQHLEKVAPKISPTPWSLDSGNRPSQHFLYLLPSFYKSTLTPTQLFPPSPLPYPQIPAHQFPSSTCSNALKPANAKGGNASTSPPANQFQTTCIECLS